MDKDQTLDIKGILLVFYAFLHLASGSYDFNLYFPVPCKARE